MSIRTHNRRFRRLALERVEDRKLLAPVAFATGMENQLSAFTSNAASGGTLPLYVNAQPMVAGGGSGKENLAIINAAAPSGSYTLPVVNAADVAFGPSGGNQLLVIGSGDLPPVRQPILPITFPTAPQGPIDIGPIVGNPYGPITGSRPLPTQPAPPVVAGPPASAPGNDPTASITPAIALPKPAVEGNGGRSQIVDVAVSTGDGPTTAIAVASDAAAGTQAKAQAAAAVPNPAGVDAVMRSIARSDDAMVPRPTSETTTSATARAAREWQSQWRSDATADVDIAPEGAIAIPAVSSGEADVTVAASNVRRAAAALQPLAAGIYQRADVFGAAALAFAGHFAVRRWRKAEADQPRPIISWRKTTARS